MVVDVKVTSTEDMNKAFKEKDDKYREWATRETRVKKSGKGGDGSSYHLPRRGRPQGLRQAPEGLCAGHQSGLGADVTERASI